MLLRAKELELLSQCADQVYEAILAKLKQLESDITRSSAAHEPSQVLCGIIAFIYLLALATSPHFHTIVKR